MKRVSSGWISKLSKLSWGTENCTAPGRQWRLPEMKLSCSSFPHLQPSFTALCQFLQPFHDRKWPCTGRLWTPSWKQALMTLWHLADELVHGKYLHTHLGSYLPAITAGNETPTAITDHGKYSKKPNIWVSNNVFWVCIMETLILLVSTKMTKHTTVFSPQFHCKEKKNVAVWTTSRNIPFSRLKNWPSSLVCFSSSRSRGDLNSKYATDSQQYSKQTFLLNSI